MNMINIYTDGSCQGNPGRGGWAAVIIGDGGRRVVSGNEAVTTNNRMELMAAIGALEAISRDSPVTIYSDSRYLVNTMSLGWKRRANLDLWTSLDGLISGRAVEWKWVRGHDGHPENEEANAIAGREAGVLPAIESYDHTDRMFSHLDQKGRAQMVDVGGKKVTHREAMARAFVSMSSETLSAIIGGQFDKGDVFAVARLAGIMGAKQTSTLIPLCHPIPVNHVAVSLEADQDKSRILISSIVKTDSKTGVEMEALTAVSVAALTIYDMCKSRDRHMTIDSIRLVSKTGGTSGDFSRLD